MFLGDLLDEIRRAALRARLENRAIPERELALRIIRAPEEHLAAARLLLDDVAAVSVGVVDGRPLLDLDYAEDSSAETDMNVVMTADGRLVEVQATAERDPFSRELLDELLDLAAAGCEEIAAAQDAAVAAERA